MRKRLLIVDDDASVRKSLTRVLEHLNYEIASAADGEEARSYLQEPGIDLLILDLNMPNRDGWDVLEDASVSQPCLPIIVITGMTDQLATFLIPGVAVLMKKPVDVPILLRKIERLLEESPDERLRKKTDCVGTEILISDSTPRWRHARHSAAGATAGNPAANKE